MAKPMHLRFNSGGKVVEFGKEELPKSTPLSPQRRLTASRRQAWAQTIDDIEFFVMNDTLPFYTSRLCKKLRALAREIRGDTHG